MKNQQKFREFMTGLGEIFDKEITVILQNVYWKALKKFDDRQCEKAFNAVIMDCKFFPKPSEIIEKIQDTRKVSGEVAWGKVMESLECGSRPDDYATTRAVQSLGGWNYLGRLTYNELHWQGRKFAEIFDYYADLDIGNDQIMLDGVEGQELIE